MNADDTMIAAFAVHEAVEATVKKLAQACCETEILYWRAGAIGHAIATEVCKPGCPDCART
jgi:hypothetical protein